MSTKLTSRSNDKLSARSRSSERSESVVSRSTRSRSSDSESQKNGATSRSTSRSSSRSTSRSGSPNSSRSSSTVSESSSKRSVGTSASSKSTVRSRSRTSTPSTRRRRKSVESDDFYNKRDQKMNSTYNNYNTNTYNKSKGLQWRKKEPCFKPRYPQHGLNALKIEGVRRDTFDYYTHRRKITEVKSRIDNRPPQIYPHVYYDMKKLRKQQEEQSMIQRNNHRLLSKLVVAMTTTRIDNVPKNRDSFIRNKERDNKRVERLIGNTQTSKHTRYLPRFAH